MSKKTVLVTGGNGFVGRHCLPLLLERGWNVHAVTRNLSGDLPGGPVWHACDLLDFDASRSLLEQIGPTHVLSIAWFSEHGAFWTNPANLDWVGASINLARESQRVGVQRVIGVGTCAEYGLTHEICDDTGTDYAPSGVYARCKYAAHLGFDAIRESLGFSTAWAMLFFPYGPHDNPGRLIPYAVRTLLTGGVGEFSAGNQVRDPLHIDDVASALVTLLESDVQGTVNICAGQPVTVRTIIETIARVIGRADLIRFGAVKQHSTDAPQWVGSTGRLNEELQWRPSHTLESGIRDTIHWHQALLEDESRG